MRFSYKKIRLKLLIGLGFLTGAILGMLLYKEFTSPSLPDSSQTKAIASTPPPQTKPPTSVQKASHNVPPTYPKNLKIPKLGINANIYPMGLTKEGAIDAPKTAWDVGWYAGSSLPGQTGTMVLDGHVNDSFNTPGVFAALKDLTRGDIVEIERGDNQLFVYQVITVEQTKLEQLDMARVVQPIEDGTEGLNLITCGGIYDPKTGTFKNRVAVFTSRI